MFMSRGNCGICVLALALALAWQMRGMARELAPNLFAGSGPGCLLGTCPEGKMTCGQPYKLDDVDGPNAARV